MNLRKAEHVSVGREQEEGDQKKFYEGNYNQFASPADMLQQRRNDEILKFHALIKVPSFSDPKIKRVHCIICASDCYNCKCVERPSRKLTELNMNDSSRCQTCKKSLNEGQKTCFDDEACRIVENQPRKNPHNKSWRNVDELSKQHTVWKNVKKSRTFSIGNFYTEMHESELK